MDSPQIEVDERSAHSASAKETEDMQEEEAAPAENGEAAAEEAEDANKPDESMGPFEQFFVNADNVAENKRLPYIMMLYGAMGWDIEEIYPYNVILKDT